jgi:hypothetical protein
MKLFIDCFDIAVRAAIMITGKRDPAVCAYDKITIAYDELMLPAKA